MEKQYQLSPEEFLRVWRKGEPLKGFSQQQVQDAEKRLGIQIPSVYREYLLRCGKDPLNQEMHSLNAPRDIHFSYKIIEEFLEEWTPEELEAMNPEDPLRRISQLPKEQWGQVTGNYLVIWAENQGVWNAGFRVEDLGMDNPPVYMTTDDSWFEWKLVSNTAESFLLSMFWECLVYDADKTLEDPKQIQEFFSSHQVDTKSLLPEKAPFQSNWIRTFWDEDEGILGIYLLNEKTLSIFSV